MPLIVSPYLTRRLGDSSLGIYSYTYSIAYYFVVLGMMGISRHGQRIIAERRKNDIALRKAFWSLYIVHIFFACIAFATFIIFILMWGKDYQVIYLIQSIYVASALFDITFLFYGLENFKSVVIRNFLVKILECILIFCFVKTPADLPVYTLIMSGSMLLGQLSMMPQALIILKPIRFGMSDIREHIVPLFTLFIAVASSTLYTVFDKTLLGILTITENVAYYEYSNKIIAIPKNMIAVIDTVIFPYACACVANDDKKNAYKYVNIALHFTGLIGTGAIWGLFGVGNLLAVLYYGGNFAVCGDIIKACSPLILIVTIGDIIRTQYLIPNHKDNLYIICLVLNALINLIFSIILIPYLGIYGAVIGTMAAEMFGLCFQLYVSKKFITVKSVVYAIIPYNFFGIVMFIVIDIIRIHHNTTWGHLILQVLAGATVYLILSLFYLIKYSSVRNWTKKEFSCVLTYISKYLKPKI